MDSNASPSAAPAAAPRSLGERVVNAAIAISVAYAAAKLMGFVQARVIGHVYGFGAVNDAFQATFGLLTTIFFIGEESLAPGYLPVFRAAKEQDGEERAWLFTSSLLNLYFLIVLAATGTLAFFPEQVVTLLTRFHLVDEEASTELSRSAMAIHFLSGMAPALLGLSLASMTYTILAGYKRFFWPAFAEAALKAALVGTILLGQKLGWDSEALVLGVLAAGVTKIVIHFLALGGKLRFYRPVLRLTDPRFTRFVILVGPLLIGIFFAKIRDIFNYIYVLSSLESGMLAVGSYGRQIYQMVNWLVPYPLSIAMLPFLVDLVAREDERAVGQFLTRASRMLLLVFVPLAAVLCVVSIPLAQFVYQTGKVSAGDAAMVGQVNACYVAVLPFLALEMAFMQAYFSTHRTISVTVIGLATSGLSMLLSYIGVVLCGVSGLRAVMLVALSYTGTKALKSVVLAAYLKSHGMPLMPLGPTLAFLARLLPLAALCGVASYGALCVVDKVLPAAAVSDLDEKGETKEAPAAAPDVPKDEAKAAGPEKEARAAPAKARGGGSGLKAMLRAAPKLAAAAFAALVVFLVGCKLLRLSELDEMFAFAKEKWRRRGRKTPAPPPDVSV
jgi:putative peptidoglycan lipid II flippase